MSRYARQIAVSGVGPSGQARIASARVAVEGEDLAAEICSLYLAGAGVGSLRVAPRLIEPCRGLNSQIAIEELPEPGEGLVVRIGSQLHRAADGDPIEAGSRAARWALARILSA